MIEFCEVDPFYPFYLRQLDVAEFAKPAKLSTPKRARQPHMQGASHTQSGFAPLRLFPFSRKMRKTATRSISRSFAIDACNLRKADGCALRRNHGLCVVLLHESACGTRRVPWFHASHGSEPMCVYPQYSIADTQYCTSACTIIV